MIVGGCCISHTPLMATATLDPALRGDVDTALDAARAFVRDVEPDLVVVFGVDHLNGFLYRMLPQFAVGLAATAIGDFASPAGPLAVDAAAAKSAAGAALAAGVDVAVSAAMEVDHGFVQPLDVLFGGIDRVRTVPVFVNAAGTPRAPIGRAAALGSALGRWAAARPERVLLLGSGGLSHDPPVPELDGADAALQERLLNGLTAAGRAEKEAGIARAAAAFAAGEGPLQPLNAAFDEQFLDLLSAGELDTVTSWDDEWLTTTGGRAVHEIRTWLAVAAGVAEVAELQTGLRFYREIPAWISGFGLVTFPVDGSNGAGRKGER